jgi:xanthine dehydrogenase YagS FAD-binding subunit
MKNFTYHRPKSPKEAVALLAERWGPTELLAGGTDLLDLQKEYVSQPDKVISLADVGLVRIGPVRDEEAYEIGAGVKLADIAGNLESRDIYPALAAAAGMVGGPQIRNMGTLGGNLCQRNRCWYFRDEHVNCLLKGGDKCFAMQGENRYHAIFTAGHKCVIVNPSTLAPVLLALPGVKVKVYGPKGDRTIPIAEFFRSPVGPGEREHVLAPNEMVVSVRLPFVKGLSSASYEVRHKQSYDWPLVQAAVAFTLAKGKATDVRVALGHVAPTPHLAVEAAKAIEGKEVNESNAQNAGEAAAEGAKPLSQNGYKVKLAAVAVKRALLLAAKVKPYWEA